MLRREEYELLYAKQQATVMDLSQAVTSKLELEKQLEHSLGSSMVKAEHLSVTTKSDTEPVPEKNWNEILAPVGIGIVVKHKTFGYRYGCLDGQTKKILRVKFDAGEKQFIFPDAFIGGFLNIDC